MKIDHTLFVRTLKAREISQKEFAEYAKIPYDTVTGWKKRGKVPAYALVIAKDMAYRKELEIEARTQMQRRCKNETLPLSYLTPKERKRIEAAFWGSNYTAEEIVSKVTQGNRKFVKQFRQNVPQELQKKVTAEATE